MDSGYLKKTQRILVLILFCLFIILGKTWHLCVFQKNIRLISARRPQKKTIFQPASRGPICDRSGKLLAVNRICYHATVYYSQILQIPRVKWITEEDGKKKKTYPRKAHIENLSKKIAQELSLDPLRVEDLIHSKASIFPHVPFQIKKNISEKEFYRLKLLEKDWLGLHAQTGSERYYPEGRLGSSILGYLGTIQSTQYLKIANELNELEETLSAYEREDLLPNSNQEHFETYRKYLFLKEKAYTLNDQVGKFGVEKRREKEMRGFYGKASYEIGSLKNFLRELPGSREPTSGMKIKLSISSELQKFAEELLAKSELEREGRSIGYDPNIKKKTTLKQPWIKGGAIVAMDPNNGEILAMASYPRFDPNDFSKNHCHNVQKWLESEKYIGRIWEGKEKLSRELFSPTRDFYEETKSITWENYLAEILPKDSSVYQALSNIRTVQRAIELQEHVEAIVYFSKDSSLKESLKNYKKDPQKIPSDSLDHYRAVLSFLGKVSLIEDQLLVIDLCRMLVYNPAFSNELIQSIGHFSLSIYFSLVQSTLCLEETLKIPLKKYFEKNLFPQWKKEHQKAYLSEIRRIEKEKKRFARPYLDYLDQKKNELFEKFWKVQKSSLLAYFVKKEKKLPSSLEVYFSQDPVSESKLSFLQQTFRHYSSSIFKEFCHTVRGFDELSRSLYGTYRFSSKLKSPVEKHLATSFYPKNGFGYLTPYSYKQACPLGSIFKIVTAYEALKQSYEKNEPYHFEMIDHVTFDSRIGEKGAHVVGYTLNHKPYPRFYRGGRLPRTASKNLGKIDLLTAIERTSNSYFSILAGDYLQDPDDLARAAKDFGFGKATGIDLPGEYSGKLPNDLRSNRTGLYSFAIGQHSLVTTPLQATCFLSALANFGAFVKPKTVLEISGKTPNYSKNFFYNPTQYSFRQELAQIGIFFPLFTQTENRFRLDAILTPPTEVYQWVYLPKSLRKTLFDGMHRVIYGTKGTARSEAIRSLWGKPQMRTLYKSYKHQVIGKTSTAEVSKILDILPSSKPKMYKHVWFSGIGFKNTSILSTQRWEKPEIVVSVYLQYADYGREVAPIAIQIIDKWRKIKYSNQRNNSQDLDERTLLK